MTDMPFREWLIDQLQAQGVSRVEFTARLQDLTEKGNAQAKVSAWWNGRSVPSAESCMMIARALAVDARGPLEAAGHYAPGQDLNPIPAGPRAVRSSDLEHHLTREEIAQLRRVLDITSELSDLELTRIVQEARAKTASQQRYESSSSSSGSE